MTRVTSINNALQMIQRLLSLFLLEIHLYSTEPTLACSQLGKVAVVHALQTSEDVRHHTLSDEQHVDRNTIMFQLLCFSYVCNFRKRNHPWNYPFY